jgi:hypothetical protein
MKRTIPSALSASAALTRMKRTIPSALSASAALTRMKRTIQLVRSRRVRR